MSDTRVGDICSHIRGSVNMVRQDSFLTDLRIYSLFLKYAAVRIKQLDDKGNRLYNFASIFETLDFVKLEECDWVEAGCSGIRSYRTMRRTCDALPMFMEGKYGPVVRSITSLDGRTPFQMTSLDTYVLISKQNSFKYNTTKYCWWLNDRLYFPDVPYPAIRIEGMFQDDISKFKCRYDDCCKPRQEQSLNVPDYILADVEASVIKELMGQMHIPSLINHTAQAPTR
jgi:hypothetical protein